MIAIVEDPSALPGDTIDRTCQPGADRHHPSTQNLGIARFHDQVSVISLQGVVHQPKARPRAALGKGAFDLPHDPHRAQRRQAATKTQGDVRRKWPDKLLPR